MKIVLHDKYGKRFGAIEDIIFDLVKRVDRLEKQDMTHEEMDEIVKHIEEGYKLEMRCDKCKFWEKMETTGKCTMFDNVKYDKLKVSAWDWNYIETTADFFCMAFEKVDE